MEPHPIPQNVTNFQFHLVGDMTLKQFGYLAIGSGVAYALFVFLAPVYPLIAWPLIIISACLGAAFAFLPYDSRPLDYWFLAFIKAVYSPTKMSWVKNSKSSAEDPLFNSRLIMYGSGLQQPPLPPHVLSALPSAMPSIPQFPKTPPPIESKKPEAAKPLPTTDELSKTVDLARQAQNLQLKIIQTERTLTQIKAEANQPTSIPIDYSQQVNKIIADLQTLVNQASQIRSKIDSVTKPAVQPVPQLHVKEKEKVKIIVPAKSKQTQMALTTFPNVINGVVKDNAGNYIENCIAVIYDREGLPVRALKTNKLGQFTGSTPLSNGTYKLALEKDNYSFDILQIELAGEVLPPLIITAK